ncbi:MAG: nucleotidyltransferase domain-containing protein [Promethearchaeota archaeon]
MTISSEIHQKLKIQLNSKLNHLPKRSLNYIEDIITLIKKEIGLDKIISIILFGSQTAARKENTKISDCDILIIFKDEVSNQKIRNVEKYFVSLEIKHNFREYNKTIPKRILGVVQQTTGMFISHFLTKKNYWENAIFHKIFRVNEVFAALFAPSKIVLCSVIDNSTLIYGIDLRESVKNNIKIPFYDMIKSIIMNMMIAIFSIVITPFKNLNSIKYELEAIKWALRASNYYSFQDAASLKTIINRFKIIEKLKLKKIADIFYKRFLELRHDPIRDIKFILKVPFRILKIHIIGILLKKINKNNNLKG